MVLKLQEKDKLLFPTTEPMCACIKDDCKTCRKARELIGKWLDKRELTKDGFVLKQRRELKNDSCAN